MALIIGHQTTWQQHLPITSVVKNSMTITSVIKKHSQVDLPSVNNKKEKKLANIQIIIKDNIPHTPSKVGVLVRITFSHTPEEAMSVGLEKACVPRKKWFCSREIEFLIEDKTE